MLIVGITHLGGNLNWAIGMYKAPIWPTMEYALEISIPNASLVNVLERCQGGMLRAMLRLVSDDKHILSGLFDMEHVAQMKSNRLIPPLCQGAYCVSPPHLFTTAISEKKQTCMQALVSVNKSATRVAQLKSLGSICSTYPATMPQTELVSPLILALSLQLLSASYAGNDVNVYNRQTISTQFSNFCQMSSNRSRKRRQSPPPEDEIGQISPQRRHGRGTNTANALRTAQPGAERNPGEVEGGNNTESIPTGSKTTRTVIRLSQTAEAGAVVADIPPTPADQRDPSMTNLRLSDSPTRVSGTRVSLGTQFAASCSGDRVCVDKTLVCKGFWDEVDATSRICLPRRSGKTFNLQLLRLFFSPLPELKCLGIMPDNDDSDLATELSRTTRMSFFNESLLKKLHAGFFADHFMKHAVIFISFDLCKCRSFGGMIMELCKAIANTAQGHLDELEHSKTLINPNAQNAEKRLCTYLETAERIGNMSEDEAARYRGLPSTLFSALSSFVHRQFGKYILLLDEYDIPFLSLFEGAWDTVGRENALSMLEMLFQAMFKVSTIQNADYM
ncbi:hypothetical protein GGI17_005994 [Coemansia sp. S146]|nr:hypothetical protein GGI17_005994 [Coemansia sp. S146]